MGALLFGVIYGKTCDSALEIQERYWDDKQAVPIIPSKLKLAIAEKLGGLQMANVAKKLPSHTRSSRFTKVFTIG